MQTLMRAEHIPDGAVDTGRAVLRLRQVESPARPKGRFSRLRKQDQPSGAPGESQVGGPPTTH